MEEITFIYKNIKTKIKFNKNEKMGDIFKKCATQIKKDIDEIYFKYNGKLINKDIIIEDIIKYKKSDKNIIYIFVYDINKNNEKEKILKEENSLLDNKTNKIGNICNYIIGEFEIKDINKKTRILNSFESWDSPNKIKTETYKYKNEYEIKKYIEIQINDKSKPFSYFYDFKIPGKYIIKYIFKTLFTKTVCLFADCQSLKKVDLSHFNTEKVTNMNSMFNGCKLLNEINLANINTQNVTDMCHIFSGCESLKNLDVSKLNTEKVTNMAYMFYECKSLKNIDVSNFNTEKVIYMTGLFFGCELLNEINVTNFNTENVTNMSKMFDGCKSLNYLDLSKFNTRKVIDMNNMFSGCTLLKDINTINFIPTGDADCRNMFSECDSFPYGCIIYSNFINAKNNKIDNNDINNIISKLKSKQNIIEYNNKINYKFIKEPNLKYKLKTNYGNKFTIFEIFTSYIDNTDYIAFSDDSDNKNLKIFYFYENKLKKKVSFKFSIKEIRYFINKNNYNEYLLIILDFGVNILYITNNYINIFEDYHHEFDDCLLVFPNKNDIYFVHSFRFYGTTGYYSDEIEHYCYSETWAELLFTNKSFLYSTKEESEFYLLLSWYNKKNNLYYIIQLPRYRNHINIYELKSKKKTYTLECPNSINDGFITQNVSEPNQHDYLNVLTDYKIYIYNLENGNLVKIYGVFGGCQKIGRFIQWKDRYIIFIIDNHLLEILDLKIYKTITVIKSNDDLCNIKKINHQIYGESLLISGKDSNGIQLWTI